MSEESEIIREAIEGLSREHRENLVQVVEQGLRARVLDSFRLLRKPWFTCPECGCRRFRTLFRGVYHGRVNVPYVICLTCGWLGWDVILSDGFETGTFDVWTDYLTSVGETCEVITTDPHHGIYHAHFAGNGSATYEYSYLRRLSIPAVTTGIYVRAYMKFLTALTDDDWYVVDIMGNNNTDRIAELYITGVAAAKKWRVLYHTGATTAYSASVGSVALNIWYCVEFMILTGTGADGEVHLWVNGTELLNLTGLDENEHGGVTDVKVGMRTKNEQTAAGMYVDCVVVDSAYIGPEATIKKSGNTVQAMMSALVSGGLFT